MNGPRQPAWEYCSDYMDWIARTQYVAQSGVPKIDLAFWLKQDTYGYFDLKSAYEPNDLAEAGYSYEYLSPDNFALPGAHVSNKIFAPERQAFKALIIRGNDSVTVSGVDRLVEHANTGLPIIMSGGLPHNLTGYNTSGTAYVRSALACMPTLSNVHSVPYGGLAASLAALGIMPKTAVSANRIWYTYLRENERSSITYAYFYNDAWDSEIGQGASNGSVTFETVGVPYIYDAFTGDIFSVLGYQQTRTSTNFVNPGRQPKRHHWIPSK